uniref:RNA helicase n=1 Tax=Percolomonas cosmopolitus TaxID=63605 RepID=A0A7S1KV15_9EUKA
MTSLPRLTSRFHQLSNPNITSSSLYTNLDLLSILNHSEDVLQRERVKWRDFNATDEDSFVKTSQNESNVSVEAKNDAFASISRKSVQHNKNLNVLKSHLSLSSDVAETNFFNLYLRTRRSFATKISEDNEPLLGRLVELLIGLLLRKKQGLLKRTQLIELEDLEKLRKEISLYLGREFTQEQLSEILVLVSEFCEYCAKYMKSKHKTKWMKLGSKVSAEHLMYGDDVNIQDPGFIQLDLLQVMTAPPSRKRKREFASESDEEDQGDTSSDAINSKWLQRECTKIYDDAQRGADVSKIILNLLQEKKDDEVSLQSGLFDILGEQGFELMATILINKDKLLLAAMQKELYHVGGHISKKTASTSNVHITNERVQQLEKDIRKQEKKVLKMRTQAPHGKGLTGAAKKEMEYLRSLKVQRRNIEGTDLSKKTLTILTVLKDYEPDLLKEGSEEAQNADDQEVTRIEGDGFEEFVIPAPPALEDRETFQKIPTSQFPKWAQLGFKGYTHLNRVQSIVYNTAFNTDENILVCAPTGCGKTNVAMMTILREVGKHFQDGVLRKDFKIVYVAPMKALASEMTDGFSRRLAPLGLQVREYTGDMQLTKREVEQTQVIVTTPEKWDVITRKATDQTLISSTKLLIFDEVHLLNEDRGPVIEVIVARTFRQIELTQSMVRVVGLSATLPNYEDVAEFLRVNPHRGLFYFDGRYRPVPLEQHFVGVIGRDRFKTQHKYDEICFDKVTDSLERGHQVMVFVHSRKGTVKSGRTILEMARESKGYMLQTSDNGFLPSSLDVKLKKRVRDSTNKELKELYQFGIGFHHAGMLRKDRNLVEELFAKGQIKVLCCTSTLAWGVNLPAHTVIIKGTDIYDAKAGKIRQVGMLDVMQIFGRAGRPQFDTSGEGYILTNAQELPRYLAMVARASPIESQLQEDLENHLNAEIALGTVSNVREGIRWLTYTYLFIRMRKNPLVYGMRHKDVLADPNMGIRRRELIFKAAKVLNSARMINYNETSGTLLPTDLGRVASHFYIHFLTVTMWNEKFVDSLDETGIMNILSSSKEFENVRVRDDETEDLTNMSKNASVCPVEVRNIDSTEGKVNTLLQAYISHSRIKQFSLVSDCVYVTQSAGRLVRALFEIALKRKSASLVDRLLLLNKCIEKRMWAFHTPLRQFSLPRQIIDKIESKDLSIHEMRNMSVPVLNQVLKYGNMANQILDYIEFLPELDIQTKVQPITRTVLRIQLTINPKFKWSQKYHGEAESFWIWVEDMQNDTLYHSEYLLLRRKEIQDPKVIDFKIPILGQMPSTLYVRAIPERWLGVESEGSIFLKDLILPAAFPPNTPLLNLNPLPITALNNECYQQLYPFKYFNPIQTQVFHTLYHTDNNVLIGAPTSSGKTIISELGCMRLWNEHPELKVVYIAPLKALVRERLSSWKSKFVDKLGKKMVELTGDYTPDIKALREADIVITTPEKWDGISRSWQHRSYVKSVGLIVMDEIHMLGQERGAILEVIVSRMRHVSWNTGHPIRLIGLSTTLANSHDLADWLGIQAQGGHGLFNFPHSVRPVQLKVHVQGYSGKHYCPRMNSMNKPCYNAILNYAGSRPCLIFVSSRRQTRLTAIDLISLCATDENPYRFVRMSEFEMEQATAQVRDNHLRHVLQYGVGIHHAGLTHHDKAIVEDLFLTNKIQVLVCTSTLAWGVNLPASLVIVKGTEFFDPKQKTYVDYSLVDVLQMMGRAGRPQFDNSGEAVIMCQDERKDFYSMMLYEPFPVESSLMNNLHDHINAEIVSGTISNFQEAVDYLTWTFLFRRLVQNPSYYGIKDASFEGVTAYLSGLVEEVIGDLEEQGCVAVETIRGGDLSIRSTQIGKISSYYYLNYKSAHAFAVGIASPHDTNGISIQKLLQLLCEAQEFAELPVRHNEDKLNSQLAQHVPWGSFSKDFESPHVKAYLLLQAHFSRIDLPISDYITDLKSVLDQTIRVCQAFIDVAAEKGDLSAILNMIHIQQMIMQARWLNDSPLLSLPHINDKMVRKLHNMDIRALPQLMHMDDSTLYRALNSALHRKNAVDDTKKIVQKLPKIAMHPGYQQGQIKVNFARRSSATNGNRAYLPNYPKPKDEGWFLIVAEGSQVKALKRVRMNYERTHVSLDVRNAVKRGNEVTLYLLSDCYIGIDQEHKLKM